MASRIAPFSISTTARLDPASVKRSRHETVTDFNTRNAATLLLKGARELGRVCARELAGFETAAVIRHLGCLHLARVDGKSPAEYLTEAQRVQVRAAAREMIAHPPKTIEEVFV